MAVEMPPRSAPSYDQQIARSGRSSAPPNRSSRRPRFLDRQPQQHATAAAAGSATAGDDDQTTAHIDRLNHLLDRWERVASKSPAQSPAGLNTSLAGAESALLSRIIDEVASSATILIGPQQSTPLSQGLRRPVRWVAASFRRSAAHSRIGRRPRSHRRKGEDAPPLSGAAETMRKVMDLSKDPDELNERFRELISTAVDQVQQRLDRKGRHRHRPGQPDDLAEGGRCLPRREHHRPGIREAR